MFFSLLRKSNVLPLTTSSFNPLLHLRRQDIQLSSKGIHLVIRWSKTNQFRSRTLEIPLPRLQGHALCPSQAVFMALQHSSGAPLDGPALVYRQQNKWIPLTSSKFLQNFKAALRGSYKVSEIGGHSFRRGGATWAYQSGVPVDVIRQLGDWRSNVYTIYTLPNTGMLSSATTRMAHALKDY